MKGRKLSSVLSIFLVLSSSLSFLSPMAECRKYRLAKPCKSLVLYLHHTIYDGRNADNCSSAIVASPAYASRTTFFGDTTVFDDQLTLDKDFHSEPVGRAQGMYIFSDWKDKYMTWTSFSFLLNSTNHHGTINCMGSYPLFQETTDIPIVGGTGDFLMARGIATFSTDMVAVHTKLQVDIKLYECY